MKRLLLLSLPVVMFMTSCNTNSPKEEGTMNAENPFFQEFDTQYGTPAFDLIKNEHYLPAFTEAIKRHDAEIKAITENADAPTFENTVAAYDKSGKMLSRVKGVFFNVTEAVSSPELQNIAKEVSSMNTKHNDNIMLNQDLFKRFKAVYETRNEAGLNAEQIRVVEEYYKDFIRNGADLNEADKETLRGLNSEISQLTLKFGDNQLAETNKNFTLVVDNQADLAGLPESSIAGAAAKAKDMGMEGKWVFQLSRASMTPFLQYAENRDLRKELYSGYFMRANNDNEFDNKALIKQIVEKRATKAKLLGFDTHADYVIAANMAETPANAMKFLDKLWNAALPVAKNEVKEMQAIIDREGGDFKLASWDWWYYAEKLRKEKYDLDENEIKPYLEIQNVVDGMFWVANQLYDITFTKVDNIQVYHPEVEVYEAKEADGTLIGLLYMDHFTRDSKRGGAWCTDFRGGAYDEEGKRIVPLISVVCNNPKGADGNPTLLSWDQTTTMFHEFGHALHGLFSDGHYKRTAGVVPRDYVELPSQVMENFAGEAQVLKHYAKHYETGEVMPEELIAKLNNSGHFNQGFGTVEYLAASILDLNWHMLNDGVVIENVAQFETDAMNKIGLIEEIWPRYRSTYFGHIFSGGYSAGYYVYIWAAVLDADAFNAFKESGDIFNKELAAKFRKHCLSEVGNAPAMDQYIKFRGQMPDETPLLERRGLK